MMVLTEEDRQTLLRIARDAIAQRLKNRSQIQIDLSHYSAALHQKRATFVTLYLGNKLRGCVGTLEARRPLAVDVATSAVSAAFSDPRFPPLTEDELMQVEIHLSILTPASPMTFTSESDLIAQLRPGVDGLLLEEGRYRGTFLPAVWGDLPEPRKFLQHLKMKAGLPPDYWSETVKVSRYETITIP